MILAKMTLLPEMIGERREITVEMSARPKLQELKDVVLPHLDGQDMEHVAVLHDRKRCSMFVGETSVLDGRIRNVRATEIYRNNWLTQHPGTDPENLPCICGPAVLFDRNVWF